MNYPSAVVLHLQEKLKADSKRKRKIRITAESVTIGSTPTVDIQLKALAETFEIEIKRSQAQWWLVNPSRSKLVRINGRKIELDSPLKHGDQILIDEHQIYFEIEVEQSLIESRDYQFQFRSSNDEDLWNYLLTETDFDEVLINGHSTIYVDWKGSLLLSPWKFSSDTFLKSKIESESNQSTGWISWRKNRSLRFQAALPPISEKVHLAIRKARQNVFSLDELEEKQFGTAEEIAFLKKAILERQSILISGATSTGKTVLLRSFVQQIPEEERLVILEEEAETDWPHPHAVSIEAGRGHLRQAVIESLRMRPSRIIVSEVRGEEAFEFLQALNTGHEGGMTTLHANSPREALSRLENLILTTGLAVNPLAVRSQLAQAINIIVQLERSTTGHRKIESISRVSGIQQGTILLGDPVALEGSGIGLVKKASKV